MRCIPSDKVISCMHHSRNFKRLKKITLVCVRVCAYSELHVCTVTVWCVCLFGTYVYVHALWMCIVYCVLFMLVCVDMMCMENRNGILWMHSSVNTLW